ncbi:MAG: hypothetical protein QNL18_09735, partial [Pseudomonadales bacterium]
MMIEFHNPEGVRRTPA